MGLKKYIFILFFLLVSLPLAGKSRSDQKMIDSLDRALLLRDRYENQRLARIETYKSLREWNQSLAQRYDLNEKIAMQYKAFICDSILHYLDLNLDLAEEMGDPALLNRTKLQLIDTYALSGMYAEAADMLRTIDHTYVRDSLEKQAYYSTAYNFYWEVQNETQDVHARTNYHTLSNQYRDSLYRVIDRSSDLFLAMEERHLRHENRLEEALQVNQQRLQRVKPYESEYAIISFFASFIWGDLGNLEKQFESLVQSAITDVVCATKDNASLRLVATQLFEEGDIDRANRYIQYCMEDARFYNARLRGVQLSSTLPLIIGTYNAKIDKQIFRLRFLVVIISLLFLAIGSMVFMLSSQKRKLVFSQKKLQLSHDRLDSLREELIQANAGLNNANAELLEANYVKESYIAQFLGLTASYMNRLESLRRTVNKKLREGKKEEALDLTRPSKSEDAELQEFYTYFDSSFLGIFPTFIEEYNKLLNEEARVIPDINSRKSLLTTEHRVFALIRLGFHDSATIAMMLRYSVNTIYNIRAQAKNKSCVPRSEFEERVKKIGTFPSL